LRVPTSPHQLGRQVPGLLRFSMPLKESQILPLSLSSVIPVAQRKQEGQAE